MKAAAAVAIVVVSSLAAACSNNQSTTTSPTTPSTPTVKTENFSSVLGPAGVVSHGFIVSTAGTVSVTLVATGPLSPALGLGLGIPNSNGANCNLSTALNTTPG